MDQLLAEFLAYEPDPKADLEYNDDGFAYIPIWKVETWLDELVELLEGGLWDRIQHHYSFHERNGSLWVASSLQLHIGGRGYGRMLLCSSFIDSAKYVDLDTGRENDNLLQTGIAEATKAGVKILGPRFGKNLNSRTVGKPKKTRERIRLPADETILRAYRKAFNDQDMAKMERLTRIYEIDPEKIHAS